MSLRALFRRFWPYARRYRRRLLLTLAFVALVPATDAATIWVYKLAVDHVLVPHDLGALLWVAGLYIGFASANAVVTFADMYLSSWVGGRFLVDLRSSVFRHLETLSLDFFDRSKLGDLIARLTGDVSSIETLAVSGIADALSYSLRIVFFSAALFYLQWQLAVAALVTGPLFWLTTRRFSHRIKQASRERRRRSGALSAVAEESLGNVALVQAYNRQATEAERLDEQAEAAFQAGMVSTRLRAIFSVIVDSIEMAGALLVMGLGTWELSRGNLTLGGLVAFLAYLSQLYSPIRRLSQLTNTLFSASASAERIAELLDAEPRVREPAAPRRLDRVRGFVAFERVSFAYPEAAGDALDEVSFGLAPGETLALVGASGAGKSTAAKLLLRFYDPGSGCIRLDGHDVRELSLDELRRHVTLLLQETLIFDGTIADNIRYGRPDASDADVLRAARAADAHDFITAMPDYYDTVVGQRGRRLSGGQRQRLAIARAMLRDAPVLVLDEPTTGLDAESGHRILAPMKRLMEGRTTLVISHNLLTVRDVDRIVVLDDGRVVERGTHDSLLAAGGRYARLWRLHQAPARVGGNVVPFPERAAR